MKRIVLFAFGFGAFAAVAAAEPPLEATAAFVDDKGRELGAATLRQTPNGVLIEVQLHHVPPGEHAFHIHEVGKCEPDTQFKSAGDHYAPRGNPHGLMAEKGPHAGDMTNQFSAQNGMLQTSVVNEDVTLAKGPASLFDRDGSSLILHARRDDYESQPSGDAGDRIACAVVKPKEATRTRQAEAEEPADG